MDGDIQCDASESVRWPIVLMQHVKLFIGCNILICKKKKKISKLGRE